MNKTGINRRVERKKLGDIAEQIAALDTMTLLELKAKYEELYGEPTPSRYKNHLRKRLAWRIQELAEGGLSERAVRRIAELGDELPERWRMRMAGPIPEVAHRSTKPAARGRGLPPEGDVLRREYRGEVHEVTVRTDGLEYRGQRYSSLSQVAKVITGTHWNGRVFFGLRSSKERR